MFETNLNMEIAALAHDVEQAGWKALIASFVHNTRCEVILSRGISSNDVSLGVLFEKMAHAISEHPDAELQVQIKRHIELDRYTGVFLHIETQCRDWKYESIYKLKAGLLQHNGFVLEAIRDALNSDDVLEIGISLDRE